MIVYAATVSGLFLLAGPKADLNRDGVVDGQDQAAVLAQWGMLEGQPADLDQNGRVDGRDLAVVLASWGRWAWYMPADNPGGLSEGWYAAAPGETLHEHPEGSPWDAGYIRLVTDLEPASGRSGFDESGIADIGVRSWDFAEAIDVPLLQE